MKTLFSHCLFIICLLTATNTRACTCLKHTPLNVCLYNAYPVIFTGKILSVEKDSNYNVSYHIQVIKWYKGDDGKSNVVVYKKNQFNMCPPNPHVGEIYLMYPDLSYNDNKKVYTIGDCNRSHSIDTAKTHYKMPKGVLVNVNGKMLDHEKGEKILNLSEIIFLDKMEQRIHTTGKQKFFWSSGDLMAEGAYVNGLPDGEWQCYTDGVLSAKCIYKNGKKKGVWKYYDKDGNLIKTTEED